MLGKLLDAIFGPFIANIIALIVAFFILLFGYFFLFG